MFIRKTTTQKYSPNGNAYATYRLVQQYRNVNGVSKQETLLNLGGDFTIAPDNWRALCDRIEQLQGNSGSLFELELPLELEKEAQRIAKLLAIRNSTKVTTKVVPVQKEEIDKDYQTVDINSTVDSDIRYIGNEHLAYQTICKLHIPDILSSAGLNQKQVNIALASIISRLIVPGSERSTHRYLTQDSALDEILGTDFSNLDLNQLYFASDNLLSCKEIIEDSLYAKEKELFNLEEVITLFDITNTYFEGNPSHSLASLGRSKEKRSDCELISLGLLLDGSGFVKKSTILPGNISEPQTLRDMLSTLEGKKDTTVIMDAGIATKDNIAYLGSEGYKYIVVKRDTDLVMPENDNVIVKDTQNNKVTVSLGNKTEGTIELYCHSSAKEKQSIQFITKMARRFEDELVKLNQNLSACDLYTDIAEYDGQSTAVILSDGQVLTNKPKQLISLLIKVNNITDIDVNLQSEFSVDKELTELLQNSIDCLQQLQKCSIQVKLLRKLQSSLRELFKKRIQVSRKNVTREYEKVAIKVGRLKQQYKSVAHAYEIEIVPNKNKSFALAINFTQNKDQINNKQAGIYCLSSNRVDLSAAELWKTYTMLTEIEAAFRSMKSELGMRPIYHQLEHRIDGHIFISILAYHVIHTIRYQLKQHEINNSWEGIRTLMLTQVRTSTTMDLKGGGQIIVRKTSRATAEQALIYKKLNIDSNPCKLIKSFKNLPREK